jgi:hypothetical protein
VATRDHHREDYKDSDDLTVADLGSFAGLGGQDQDERIRSAPSALLAVCLEFQTTEPSYPFGGDDYWRGGGGFGGERAWNSNRMMMTTGEGEDDVDNCNKG